MSQYGIFTALSIWVEHGTNNATVKCTRPTDGTHVNYVCDHSTVRCFGSEDPPIDTPLSLHPHRYYGAERVSS